MLQMPNIRNEKMLARYNELIARYNEWIFVKITQGMHGVFY